MFFIIISVNYFGNNFIIVLIFQIYIIHFYENKFILHKSIRETQFFLLT